MTHQAQQEPVKPPVLAFSDSHAVYVRALSSSDDEVAQDRITVTFVDPVLLQRIQEPCRSVHCQHIQCFDWTCFTGLNARKKRDVWKCPICSIRATVESVYVDSVFLCLMRRLQSMEGAVIFNTGHFEGKTVEAKDESSSVEVIDLVSDDEADSSAPQHLVLHSENTLSNLQNDVLLQGHAFVTLSELVSSMELQPLLFAINNMTDKELKTLDGVGQKLAKEIAGRRPFTAKTEAELLSKLQDLRLVSHRKGISLIAQLKHYTARIARLETEHAPKKQLPYPHRPLSNQLTARVLATGAISAAGLYRNVMAAPESTPTQGKPLSYSSPHTNSSTLRPTRSSQSGYNSGASIYTVSNSGSLADREQGQQIAVSSGGFVSPSTIVPQQLPSQPQPQPQQYPPHQLRQDQPSQEQGQRVQVQHQPVQYTSSTSSGFSRTLPDLSRVASSGYSADPHTSTHELEDDASSMDDDLQQILLHYETLESEAPKQYEPPRHLFGEALATSMAPSRSLPAQMLTAPQVSYCGPLTTFTHSYTLPTSVSSACVRILSDTVNADPNLSERTPKRARVERPHFEAELLAEIPSPEASDWDYALRDGF